MITSCNVTFSKYHGTKHCYYHCIKSCTFTLVLLVMTTIINFYDHLLLLYFLKNMMLNIPIIYPIKSCTFTLGLQVLWHNSCHKLLWSPSTDIILEKIWCQHLFFLHKTRYLYTCFTIKSVINFYDHILLLYIF